MQFFNAKGKSPLKIITIGGTEKVTKNLTVYEYDDEIVIVDCGLGFPDIFDMPGVDVLIPDFTYLLENSHKIKALFITHGHEDHIGSVSNLLQELPDLPVYGTKLVGEILKIKLNEKNTKELGKRLRFHLFDPTTGSVDLGNFKMSCFRINHSIPEPIGIVLKTPEGVILHVADFKFDPTPVLDQPADEETIKKLGNEGVLCLLSDCLLATAEGFTKSEKALSETFLKLFSRAGKRQVLVTTISSNVSRMYQIMAAAMEHGRKVVPSGRTIEQMVDAARRLGYLPFPSDFFVEETKASDYDQGDLVYIIAGCYGQPGSSLGRLSRGEHETIQLEEDAIVIFSGDPNPPGADIMVEKVMDALTLRGAEVIYGEIQDNLHVSGHGTKEDLKKMARLANPKYFIPIGGSITKMRAYTNMLREMGISKDRVFECLEGDSVEFFNGKAKKGRHINVKPVYMDGNKTEEVDPIVVQDRTQLSNDGVFIVVVPSSKGTIYPEKLEIITRGFIYVKNSRDFMNKSRKFINKTISKDMNNIKDWGSYKRKLESKIEHFLKKETSMSPLVVVHSLDI